MKVKSVKDKNLYQKLLDLIGKFRYRVFDTEESKELFPYINSSWVTMGVTTGPSTLVSYTCENFKVDADKPVIIISHIRPDAHNGKPHLNTDSFVLVPTTRGILRIPKEDPNGHYTEILEESGLKDIENIENLPANKSGSVNEFYQNRTSPVVKITCKEENS